MIDFKKLSFVTQKDDRDNPQAARQQQMAAQDTSVIQKFDEIVAAALAKRASEIHVEAMTEQTRVRFRIGKQLEEADSLEPKLHLNLVNRIKVLAAMDITKRGVAQKGYFKVKLEERDVELVAIIMPTPVGEKALIKIQYRQSLGLNVSQLGMYPNILQEFKKLLDRPNGLLLIAGSPGSGRTTTCYACLQELNDPSKSVASMESQIRYDLPGIIQSKPEDRHDYSFLDGLRASVDMEPDVLYIGEMNDDAIARLALSAAFGKRIVVGRINASNGANAMLSLLDMGLPGFLVASGVLGVLSQRLVRRLCENCRQAYRPDETVLAEIGVKRPDLTFFRAGGCDQCGQTGFIGHLGLFELFVPNDRVREKIISRASAAEVYAAAAETGLVPLRHDGVRKVSQGLTTLEEVLARL
ncbi:MAG: Flp pilus assembly complex ATPase component TadA [Deltaproteobacteria bacterium]|nr:Flp pilus assembly complex ATPase component TadA [Deltaproteobacteria bacterium]